MSNSKTVIWLLVVVAVAATAGWCIPELYDSTELDQSSIVPWHVVLSALSASVLVFFAVTIGWLVWHRAVRNRGPSDNVPSRQFGLRSVFAVTTAVAMGACAWSASQKQTEIKLVGFYVTTVLAGTLVGRATFLANADSSTTETVAQDIASSDGTRRFLLAGLALISIQLGICWRLEYTHGFAGIVWLVIFAGILWYSKPRVRMGTACYMAAIFLPYVWLVRSRQGFESPSALVSFFSVAPGIVPAAMVKWTPNSLLLATWLLVIESLVGYWVACRRQIAIGWLAGCACSASIFASFGLHALFRA